MRPGIIIASLSLLLILATGASLLGRAQDARRMPLTGRWTGVVYLDTSSLRRPEHTRASLPVVLELEPGEAPNWVQPFWRASYTGSYEAEFPLLIGRELPVHEPAALAVRHGPDAVWLYLGQPCCDAGGLVGQGQVVGDTLLSGRWQLDLDGALVGGRFRFRQTQGAGAPDA